MSIVTKTGDQGTTSLMYQRRVPKTHPRIEACGCVDELNAALGLARAAEPASLFQEELAWFQKDLIRLMGELATAPEDFPRYTKQGFARVSAAMTQRLEEQVVALEKETAPLQDWATPGANFKAAALDLARTICRRAERRVCAVKESGELGNTEIIPYLNRLSDLLWLMARRAEATKPPKAHKAKSKGPSRSALPAALILAVTGFARAENSPIRFSEIGAKVMTDYQGDALVVTATPDGAQLRCGFQQLEGHATSDGLWLESTLQGRADRFRSTATVFGRINSRAREWGLIESAASEPTGMTDVAGNTALAARGIVAVLDQLVRFTRPGLLEEYSVSVDGVRQDFVIAERPAGTGDLWVELDLRGARAEPAPYGARLMLEGSGRALAYSRLRATDAAGRQLEARLEVLSAGKLAIRVADGNATYPVRVDPTFSDANWVSMNPGMPGADSTVYALTLDANGNLYVGGNFTTIGTVVTGHVARWNGSTWSALGAGVDDSVYALAMSGNILYAGGHFSTAGGVAANYIAAWDGSAWSALGAGWIATFMPWRWMGPFSMREAISPKQVG